MDDDEISEGRLSEEMLYAYPNRSCVYCKWFPCMPIFTNCRNAKGEIVDKQTAIQKKLVCNFARYGCLHYVRNMNKAVIRREN